MFKLALISALAGSAAAFAPAQTGARSTSLNSFSADDLPGALAPMGFFDPLGFAEKADEATLKRYREAEVTHGRVSMLAVIGFLVGEKVEGSSFLFDASISGPAISHPGQVPPGWAAIIIAAIGFAELQRAKAGFVDPTETSFDNPGELNADYYPGDIGFDPLGLKPDDAEELDIMITKELQNGRLAMLAAAGFLAQEAVDGKGILEHFSS
ncbi:chlorophyll a-b binding domain-containing protein [Skeletonema marinoi]|uniref:Chlorophyll a-b binding domain-containing protein n=1 Tax=Skeletonema marinoi TaxID=267567 RepID=A0AAD9DGT5_9STRA|nr:chlorophyll a-b binding domain-containing protein [Skeletonema marinoi]